MNDNEWKKDWREAEKAKILDQVWQNVVSLFQSKRDHLKKQVTHWYGKFMIVKAENNKLRAKIRTMEAAIAVYNLRMSNRNPVVVGEGAPGRKQVSELVEMVSVQKKSEFLNKEPIKC